MSVINATEVTPTLPTFRTPEHRMAGNLQHSGEPILPTGPEITHAEKSADIPNVTENLQVAGAANFEKFERQIDNFDRELRNFANATRQLGSSVAILSSAFHLRERLAQIVFLFRENAAHLFPERISHATLDTVSETQSEGKRRRRRRHRVLKPRAPPQITRPVVNVSLDLETFPEQLEAFATDVVVFLDCLNEFPEFMDEAVNTSIRSFEADLKYWASCLKEYRGYFRNPSVQRYIHELSSEMGDHIDNITSTISMFIEVGVPTIRFAQKHGAANLLNLSTVATLFSAVTATTIQFSYQSTETPIANAVNIFWFSSLVFSIAASVNSLLGVTWNQAMYRSPGHRVPWWVLMWIKRSPLVFLVMSVACFSIGLCCFAYASAQSIVTSILTTIFTGFTSFGLAVVSTWFASERYIFFRHRGKKWLSDILIEYPEKIGGLYAFTMLRQAFRDIECRLARIYRLLQRSLSKFIIFAQPTHDDLEAGTLPLAYHNNAPPLSRPSPSVSIPLQTQASTLGGEPAGSASRGKKLWKQAIRGVKVQTAVPLSPELRSVVDRARKPPTDPSYVYYDERVGRVWREGSVNVVSKSHTVYLRHKLNELEPIQELTAHSGLVRHLQFSPDGKYLATSSWDRTSVIFRVGDPFVSHRTLAFHQSFVGQVAWSPDGQFLLTKLLRAIKIWNAETGVCIKTIDRETSVESMAWLPDGTAFISVEGSRVTKMDTNGTILNHYDFGRTKLHDVAVTPDASRLIGVGTLLESPTGLQPSKARPERRLTVYNMETLMIENQTPVSGEVRDITVVQNSHGATLALVSYENQAPPQLWRLHTFKDVAARLILRQTYISKTKIDFAGPSYFGGRNNELVMCAGKAGDIHIWDSKTGVLLHHIHPQAISRDMTCLAWNHAHDNPFMFATGSYDGTVHIWAKPPGGEDLNNLEYLDPTPDLDIDAQPSLEPKAHDQEYLENSHPPQP